MVLEKSTLIIAHWSDIHFNSSNTYYGSIFDAKDVLTRAVIHLNKTTPLPDILLITGDLVDYPTLEEYELFRSIMDELIVPYYVVPGNHDDSYMVYNIFKDLGYFSNDDIYLNYVIDDYPVRIIGFDTSSYRSNMPKRYGGYAGEVCSDRLKWIDLQLSNDSIKPTIIFMHHQPKFTRIGYPKGDVFFGVTELENIIKGSSQIEAILCGHLHRHIQFKWANKVVQVAPSISVNRTLTLDNKMKKEFIAEPTGALIYLWNEELGLICHTDYFGGYKKYNSVII